LFLVVAACFIDVKYVDPKNKNVKNRDFMKKNKENVKNVE